MEDKNMEIKREDNKKLREYIKNSTYEKYICQFLVIAAAICLFFIIYRFEAIRIWATEVMEILQPINIGIVIAYLINPVVRYWERKLENLIEKINKIGKRKLVVSKTKSVARGTSIALSLIMVAALIVGIILIVVPELIDSILGLITDVPAKIDRFNVWFQQIIVDYNINNQSVTQAVYDITTYVENWFTTDFAALVNKVALPLTNGIVNFVGVLFNLLIGIIVSAYLLAGKERFARMLKKILFAFVSEARANIVLESLKTSDKVFGGFISGKIIDSLIIGMLCFIAMTLMDMPYIVVVSVVVGVTNIIPFFGPYIGGIPSAILILIANPVKGIYFAIFIIILQQFDGNILGPKIIGETTGLTAFWVVFAILIGGGLFGMFGLIAGVPTFAVLYGFVKKEVEHRLEIKGIKID